jgi:hypothetical protein
VNGLGRVADVFTSYFFNARVDKRYDEKPTYTQPKLPYQGPQLPETKAEL